MIQCDTDKLTKAIMELEPKRRINAVKGAFRKAATKVKKKAVENLRQSKIRKDKSLEKGIRGVVWKKKTGFRVTIGTKKANKKGKGASGWHTNRQGKTLPILIWMEEGAAEGGTKKRSTKTKIFKRKRTGHNTGKLKPRDFMGKTQREMKDKITDELRTAMEESINKALKKYGSR